MEKKITAEEMRLTESLILQENGWSGATSKVTFSADGQLKIVKNGTTFVHVNPEAHDLEMWSSKITLKAIASGIGLVSVVELDGRTGNLILGGGGQDGDVVVRNKNGKDRIHLDGDGGRLTVGKSGGGHLSVLDAHGKDSVRIDGNQGNIVFQSFAKEPYVELGRRGHLYLGGANIVDGGIEVRNKKGEPTVYIDGGSGDVILMNADCAEDFDIVETEEVDPGTVLVLDHTGKLRSSTDAYDKRVAGVVSGAGGYKPGMVLDRKPAPGPRLPVALMGKVFCKADAQFGSIDVGDLLTTSATPGHAMKALDPAKAFGAVIGKALQPLRSGQGLVPIIVALQ